MNGETILGRDGKELRGGRSRCGVGRTEGAQQSQLDRSVFQQRRRGFAH